MGVVVEVSARTFNVPRECVCCGGASETTLPASHTRRTGKRVIRETTRSLDFPFCRRCVGHINRWQSGESAFGVCITLGVVLGLIGCVGSEGNTTVGGVLILLGLVAGTVMLFALHSSARGMCGPSCVVPQHPVKHLGWNGSISTFSFESSRYAARFAAGNERKLINVSHGLEALMISPPPAQVAPIVLPRPPAAPVVSSWGPTTAPRVDVTEWIAKIESYKGAEARRNALKRALESVVEPAARRELVIAAGRIEVAAVLDKVDGLKGVAAKKRHLEGAISALRADDVPDELQQEELRVLRQRLDEL